MTYDLNEPVVYGFVTQIEMHDYASETAVKEFLNSRKISSHNMDSEAKHFFEDNFELMKRLEMFEMTSYEHIVQRMDIENK